MDEFWGIIALGDTLYGPLVTRNGSLVPTAPTAAPTFTIYAADMSGSLQTGTSANLDSLTGVYYITQAVTSGNGFAAGKIYTCVATYAISGTTYRQTHTFQVA